LFASPTKLDDGRVVHGWADVDRTRLVVKDGQQVREVPVTDIDPDSIVRDETSPETMKLSEALRQAVVGEDMAVPGRMSAWHEMTPDEFEAHPDLGLGSKVEGAVWADGTTSNTATT